MVAVASCKGSPGATTVALGLAGCWPAGGGVLVEADPHGGDLGDRFGYAAPPGVGSAAAVARHGTGGGWLSDHLQRLPLGVEVLLGARSAESAAVAVASLALRPEAVRDHGGPAVVVDVGRVGPASAAVPLVSIADVLLVVARPELADLRHVATGLARLPHAARGRARLVLAGKGTYGPREISRDLGVLVAVTVPRDRWGAAVLSGRGGPVRGWRRLRMPRVLAGLASQLAAGEPSGTRSVEAAAGGEDGPVRPAGAPGGRDDPVEVSAS